MEWFRWFHGAVSDDKWPLIARRSGQSVAVVVAVWAALLECASQADQRGSIAAFDPESMDALLQVQDGTCHAVLAAMSEGKKPRIADGRIAKWNERQPMRERDDDSAGRVRSHRARKKEAQKQDDAGRAAGESPCNGVCTPGNATVTPLKRQVTPRTDKRREEEKREETPPVSIPGNEGEAPASFAVPKEASGEGDLSSMPGIEFLELRQYYDKHARPEAPLAGFAEYKQARAARTWPGQDAVYRAIDALAANDADWKRGFAPGLGRFLREQQWQKKPVAGAARPGGSAAPDWASGGLDPTLAGNMGTVARVLARRHGLSERQGAAKI